MEIDFGINVACVVQMLRRSPAGERGGPALQGRIHAARVAQVGRGSHTKLENQAAPHSSAEFTLRNFSVGGAAEQIFSRFSVAS